MRNATKPFYLIALTLTLLLPGLAFADAMDDFKQTYQAYLKAMDDKDWNQALTSSKTALDEGLKVFNTDGPNVANLRFNYARELNRSGQAAKAAEQLKLCVDAKQVLYGQDSDELLSALMALGDTVAATDTVAANKYYQHAIDIVGKQHDEGLGAKLQLEAGLTLAKYEAFKDAQPYLAEAHGYYLKKFGAKDGRSGLAAINLGKIYAHDNDDKNAREVLNSALEAFANDDPVSKQFNIGTRRLLVTVLERMGRDDEATPHRIAIAMSNAVGGSAKPELLYRDTQSAMLNMGTRDNSGKEVAGASGEVLLAYTVDATGKPVDISVESTDNRALNDTAVGFVKTFRYAPAVADGKPVATPDMEFHFHQKSSVNVKVER